MKPEALEIGLLPSNLVLYGYLMPHHRFLLGEMLHELNHIESQLARLEAEIESQMRPFQKLCVPG